MCTLKPSGFGMFVMMMMMMIVMFDDCSVMMIIHCFWFHCMFFCFVLFVGDRGLVVVVMVVDGVMGERCGGQQDAKGRKW